jgi:hypothetical protein
MAYQVHSCKYIARMKFVVAVFVPDVEVSIFFLEVKPNRNPAVLMGPPGLEPEAEKKARKPKKLDYIWLFPRRQSSSSKTAYP